MKNIYLILILVMIAFSQEKKEENLFELSLEELLNVDVTTASKKEEKLTEAPAIMSVITKEQIEEYGIKSIYQLLSLQPGFVLFDTYWKKDIITSRGILQTLYNDKILVLINGIPTYDASALEYFFELVPISQIERIEIIRGPGSTLYGTNAFSAVINILTKNNSPKVIAIQ